jgi:hypothetical protein
VHPCAMMMMMMSINTPVLQHMVSAYRCSKR